MSTDLLHYARVADALQSGPTADQQCYDGSSSITVHCRRTDADDQRRLRPLQCLAGRRVVHGEPRPRQRQRDRVVSQLHRKIRASELCVEPGL